MTSIKNIYAPFNYSTTRCYVIRLSVMRRGYMKLEHKLPAYIQRIKGVLITSAARSKIAIVGYASLNFNGQAFKSVQIGVPRYTPSADYSSPSPLDEAIEPNSFLQGYYLDATKLVKFPYIISIYIHYTPVPKD